MIFRSFNSFLLKQDTYENNSNLDVFIHLTAYIRSGTYTSRRNKSFLLQNWTKLSNKELSDHLKISVSAVSYAKKAISDDLKQSLGQSILEFIRNNNFEAIQQVLIHEETYFISPSLFPSTIVSEIKQRTIDIPLEVGTQYTTTQIQELFHDLILNVTKNVDVPQFYHALQFLQKIYIPKLIEELSVLDIQLLNKLIQILMRESGSTDLRHNLISLLEGTLLTDDFVSK